MGKKSKKRAKYRRAGMREEAVEVVWDPQAGLFTARYLNDLGSEQRGAHRGGVQNVDRNVLAGGVVSGRGMIAIGESFVSYLLFTGALGEKDVRMRRESAIQWLLDRYHKAGLHQRTAARYEPSSSKGVAEMSDSASAALKAYGAMWFRLGEARANLLQDTVIFDAATSDINALAEALDALALWQGFVGKEKGLTSSRPSGT